MRVRGGAVEGGKSVTWGGEIHFVRWEVSRGKNKEGIFNQPGILETASECFRERENRKERRDQMSWAFLMPPTPIFFLLEQMHSPSSDHAFNQLFRQKTKVCTQPWIMEGEKAERRMEVRNWSKQWQEVSIAQIRSDDRQLRPCSGQAIEEELTGANEGPADT